MLMVIGTICACGVGAAGPLMMITFGNMSDIFIKQAYDQNVLKEKIANMVANISATCENLNITCAQMNITSLDELM